MLEKKKRRIRGQTLIGVVITATIMAVMSMGFMSMFRSQSRATRRIAARGGATDLSHGLDALFGSPQCATTGSSNYLFGGVSPVTLSVTPGPPPSYSVSIDTLNFANGTFAITSDSNATISSLIHPYSISSISFSPLGGNSATMYPFKLTVSFTDPNGGLPALPLIKFITLFTDATNKVVGACYNGGNSNSNPNIITRSTGYSNNHSDLQDIDDGIVPNRTLTFNKSQQATSLRIEYTDNFGGMIQHPNPLYFSGIACNWEILIDGASCPGGVLLFTMQESGSFNVGQPHILRSSTVVGYCDSVSTGLHTLTVRVSRNPSYANCKTGYNGRWTIAVQEVN